MARDSDSELVVGVDSANTTNKRKREGEDEPLTNGHVSKRLASYPSYGDDQQQPIVLDEDDGGAILID